MFTGLIAEMGRVDALRREGSSYRLTIEAKKIPLTLFVGESVCCNGACLTVTHFDAHCFTVDVMPETVRHTTLKLGAGLDGHLVLGHVDGVGTISRIVPEGIAKVTTITAPKELLHYMVKKGSIAIDGISLTLTDVTETAFSVSLIPLTVKDTTLGKKKVGDAVNLETDILGKYVEKLINHKLDGGLTKASLLENGFL